MPISSNVFALAVLLLASTSVFAQVGDPGFPLSPRLADKNEWVESFSANLPGAKVNADTSLRSALSICLDYTLATMEAYRGQFSDALSGKLFKLSETQVPTLNTCLKSRFGLHF